MNQEEVNYQDILEYIKEKIKSCQEIDKEIKEDCYHHNAPYEKMSSIIRYGILSNQEKANLFSEKISEQVRKILLDDYHVNGLDEISLALVGLEDVRSDRNIYNPFVLNLVDILISSQISAYRNSTNYENEFLASTRISNKNFKAFDIRILKYISSLEELSFKEKLSRNNLKMLVKYYNQLKEMIIVLRTINLEVPIREMSYETTKLNQEKLYEYPTITLK